MDRLTTTWRTRWGRPLLVAVALVFLGSTLAACTVSVAGGMAGGALSLLALIFVLAGTATSTTGCTETSVCLSMVIDQDVPDGGDVADTPETTDTTAAKDSGSDTVGPCLSQPLDVGPCLGPDLTDTTDTKTAADIGPCLSVAVDAGKKDVADTEDQEDVGPCLSGPLDANEGDAAKDSGSKDAGPKDAGPKDAGPKDAGKKDTKTGPCLSPPIDAGFAAPEWIRDPGADSLNTPKNAPPSRAAVQRKLAAAGILPADVAARLGLPASTPEHDENA